MQLEVVPGIVPSVLATLGPGESVFAEHGIVLYKEDPVLVGRKNIHSKGFLSTLKRTTVGGLPFFMAEFTGPGHACFSRDGVGEVRIIELQPGETLDVAEGSLVCADNRIAYEVVYTKGATGWMGMWMDQLTGPGAFALHAYGNFVTLKLGPGETVVCERGAILHKTPGMVLEPHVQRVGGGLLGRAFSQEMYIVHGPGTVGLQTGR
ncbi:MAG: AIM24 family protein [Thermoplasmata archaeon]|nr:AIM24 family protein [Thermoplasmata archaeon]